MTDAPPNLINITGQNVKKKVPKNFNVVPSLKIESNLQEKQACKIKQVKNHNP